MRGPGGALAVSRAVLATKFERSVSQLMQPMVVSNVAPSMVARKAVTVWNWNAKMSVPGSGLIGRRAVRPVAEMGHRVVLSQRIQTLRRDVTSLLLQC